MLDILYLRHSTQSGILLCLWYYKAAFITSLPTQQGLHNSTFSTHTVNILQSTETFLYTPSGSGRYSRHYWGPVLFLIHMNSLSRALENPICLFAENSTLCHTVSHPTKRHKGAAEQLTNELELYAHLTNGTCLSTLENVSLTLSLWKDWQANTPVNIYGQLLEEDHALALEFLDLNISHSLTWSDHIAKLDSKTNSRQDILSHSKSVFEKETKQNYSSLQGLCPLLNGNSAPL